MPTESHDAYEAVLIAGAALDLAQEMSKGLSTRRRYHELEIRRIDLYERLSPLTDKYVLQPPLLEAMTRHRIDVAGRGFRA